MTICSPRWATPRTPSRDTLGDIAGRIAEALQTPLMPWQKQVLDVSLEIDPPTGRLVYRDVTLTVPRQSGKTTLLLVLVLLRALSEHRQVIKYTAQHGAAARQKVVDDWLPQLQASPFKTLFRPRLTSGHERLLFRNGSSLSMVATTEKAGHGSSIDVAILDESFAHADSRTEQALRPAMMTRPCPQFWVVSTAGTPHGSPYLLEKVETGRQLAEAGVVEHSCSSNGQPTTTPTRTTLRRGGHACLHSAAPSPRTRSPPMHGRWTCPSSSGHTSTNG